MKNKFEKISKKSDYKGFIEHLEDYEDAGINIGTSDLIRLAEVYNCEIPTYKDGKLVFKNK